MQIGQVLPLIGDPPLGIAFLFVVRFPGELRNITLHNKVQKQSIEPQLQSLVNFLAQTIAQRTEAWRCYTNDAHL